MNLALKDSSTSYSTVKLRVSKFKKSSSSTDDESFSGHPIEIGTTEMIEKIHKIVLEDRRLYYYHFIY